MATKTADEIKTTQNRIVKIESDRASNRERISEQERRATEAADEAAKFATDAANGNDKALDKHLKAKGTETLHREQARILEATDGELQNQLAEAHATLNRLLMKQKGEILIGDTGKFHAIATELSNALTAPAAQCADLKKQLRETFVAALPLLGDRQCFTALEKSINHSVDQAVRAQLQKSFAAVGIDLFDSKRYQDSDFESVMKKPINDLMAAIETVMRSNSPEHVEGRVRFRVRTQVSGLFGMALRPGQLVSLDPNDPVVLRVVNAGGLERIVEDKAVSA
jgi:rRNA-processing protein FCF1